MGSAEKYPPLGDGGRPRPGIERFLGARSAVVVGASDRRGVHRVAIRNLLAGPGEVWGVHPRRRSVLGLRCVPGAAELPAPPDVALVLVGHRNVVAAVEDVLAAGARSLVLPGLGNEAGPEGAAVAAEVAALAERHGVPTVGVNCMGVTVPDGLSPWVGTLGRELRPGAVAAVVQSGSAGEALCALGPRVGFRCIASVGTEATRDVADWIAHLAEDERTEAVALFLESVRRPAALKAALERLAEAGKPLVCLRVGRSEAGARAAVAHTDAILTPARAFAALSRYVGLIEATDFDEFVEMLELLGRGTRIAGPRLAAVTQSGGEAALLADLAEDAGLRVPRFGERTERRLREILPPGTPVGNPLDAWAIDDTADVYRQVFAALAESGEFDTLLVQLDQSPFVGELEAGVALKISEALIDGAAGRLPVAVLSGQASEPVPGVRELAEARGVPLLRGARPALRAIAGLAARAPRRRPRPPERVGAAPLRLPSGGLGEVEAARALAPFGVRFARVRRVASAEEARAAARRLGFPVVLKQDRVSHRARRGGVILGIDDEAELEAALGRIRPPALLAEQVEAGPEVYCGGHHHAGYGPIVCVGWGGLLLEQMPTVTCALAPVDAAGAAELLREVPGLERATSSGLRAQLAGVVVGLSRFVAGLPVGTSVDLNPVILSEERGAVAVDAMIAA